MKLGIIAVFDTATIVVLTSCMKPRITAIVDTAITVKFNAMCYKEIAILLGKFLLGAGKKLK